MQMLSEDDLNLRDMTSDELAAAWDLWFDLAQSTNDADAAYEHGVFTSQASPADARPCGVWPVDARPGERGLRSGS